jgi:hypothetical protein
MDWCDATHPLATPSTAPDQVERPHRPGVSHGAQVLLLPLLGRRPRPGVREQIRSQQMLSLTPRTVAIVPHPSPRPTTHQAASSSPIFAGRA